MWSPDGQWWWDGRRWVAAADLRRKRWRLQRTDENLGTLIPLGLLPVVLPVVLFTIVLLGVLLLSVVSAFKG